MPNLPVRPPATTLAPVPLLLLLLLVCCAQAGLGCGRRLIGSVGDGGIDTLPVTPNPPQACTSEGWCWTHPLPTSDRFVQAFGVGPDDLWLIGASGTIVRFAGGVWSALPSPTNALSAVWSSAGNEVWAGGPAGMFRWNGQSWTQAVTPTSPNARAVNAIWGCAPNDIWAMGVVALRWNGSEWVYVQMPSMAGTFRTIWGAGCNDIWAGFLDDAVASGKVMHWDGDSWTATEDRPVEQLAGTGADDVWSLAQGQLYHWSGLGPGTLSDSRTLGLFPVGAGAVGTMDDAHMISVRAPSGATSIPAAAPPAVGALWGRSASDIWGFGAQGVATHWDGGTWRTQLPGWALTGDAPAVKVTGSGPADLWAVVGGALLHGDGSTWRTALTPADVGGTIYDVWAPAPDDVWVLGGDKVIHRWNGAAWRTEDPSPRGATTAEMRAISGIGPDDVWIVRGTNSVLHWDGHTWVSRQPLVENIVDIWAAGPNEVWVIGDRVSRWSGGGWSGPRIPTVLGDAPFKAVGGTGPTDVWILAGGYVLKVSDNYLDLTVVMSSDWRAVSLSPAAGGGVWVMLQDGTIASRLYRLVGPDPSTIGTALLAPAGLNDLWTTTDGTLWAAGGGGALIRKRPTP